MSLFKEKFLKVLKLFILTVAFILFAGCSAGGETSDRASDSNSIVSSEPNISAEETSGSEGGGSDEETNSSEGSGPDEETSGSEGGYSGEETSGSEGSGSDEENSGNIASDDRSPDGIDLPMIPFCD